MQPQADTGPHFGKVLVDFSAFDLDVEAEAAHPGPRAHHSGPIIGCMNHPTGILGKSHLIAELPRGSESIWAVSESHLTKHGKQKCTEELRYHEAGYH